MDGGGPIAIWATGLGLLAIAIAFVFASPGLTWCSARSLWRLHRVRYVAERLALADRISCDGRRLYFLPRVQSGRLELHFGANAGGWPSGALTPETCVRSAREQVVRRSAVLISLVVALLLAWVLLIALDPDAEGNFIAGLGGAAVFSTGGQAFASLVFVSALFIIHTFCPFSITIFYGTSRSRDLADGAPDRASRGQASQGAQERSPIASRFVGSEETLNDLGRFSALQRRALGDNHPSVFASYYYRSMTRFHLRRFDDALSDIGQYADVQRRALGRRNQWVLRVRYLKAVNLAFLDKWPDALAELDELAPIQTAVLGETHPDTLMSRSVRVAAWSALGRYADVVTEADALAPEMARVLGPDDQFTLSNADLKAAAIQKLGANPEAVGQTNPEKLAPTPFAAIRSTRRKPSVRQRELLMMAGAACLALGVLIGGGIIATPWLQNGFSGSSAGPPTTRAAPSGAREAVAISSTAPEPTPPAVVAGSQEGIEPPVASDELSFSMTAGQDGANVRAEPRTDAPLIVRLSAGSSLRVMGRMEASGYDWFRVALPDRRLGFVREDVVALTPGAPLVEQYTPASPMEAGREGANVRAAPRTDAPLLARLDPGSALRITGRAQASGHAWFRVALADLRSGFVREDVVQRASSGRSVEDYTPDAPMEAGRDGANVRAEPRTDATLIVRLEAGEGLRITGRTQAAGRSWFRVVLPDRRSGFVRDDVVEHSNRAPTE